MGWALVAAEPHHRKSWVKRFDPRFWTVDFARPMMAAVTATGGVLGKAGSGGADVGRGGSLGSSFACL